MTEGGRASGRSRAGLAALVARACVASIGIGTSAGQRAGPVRIGVLTESWGPTPAIVGLRDGLAELGYRENEHFVLGVRFTEGDRAALPAAARQLVERGADILTTGGGGVSEARAVRMASDRIPVVFIGGSDPVGDGLVQSIARPGGNVTGIADLDIALAPKRLEILRELVPGLRRILLPYDATDPASASHVSANREAARRLGVTLVERPVRTQEEADAALARVRKADVDGILSPRFLTLNLPGLIIDAGRRAGIPAMMHNSFHVERGGLASYAANHYQLGRHAARLVDRIIKGARPAELPVEQTTTFELVINRTTARMLGLTISPSLLVRVDRLVD